jgi:hypothetical protein
MHGPEGFCHAQRASRTQIFLSLVRELQNAASSLLLLDNDDDDVGGEGLGSVTCTVVAGRQGPLGKFHIQLDCLLQDLLDDESLQLLAAGLGAVTELLLPHPSLTTHLSNPMSYLQALLLLHCLGLKPVQDDDEPWLLELPGVGEGPQYSPLNTASLLALQSCFVPGKNRLQQI